jgi:hypothetical protein
MSRAEVQPVPADPGRAKDFLAQARRFLEDAEGQGVHLESAVVLYWNACISAMDAVLTVEGRRVGSGDHAHAVRIAAAGAVLGAGYSDLFERLDEWRRERHDVSYAAVTPSIAVVAALQTDARDIVAAAATHLK